MNAEYLVRALDEAFAGPAWHGPALAGSIRGVTPDEAAWRPASDRNCIWDLVLHAAYWKYVVRRRITGEKRGRFERKGSNFFPLPDPPDAAAWRADVELLQSSHARLRETVADLSDADLARKTSRGRWTIADTIRGIALHDVYHAGQIQLLKRLREEGVRTGLSGVPRLRRG